MTQVHGRTRLSRSRSLHERLGLRMFADRHEAGERLAGALLRFASEDPWYRRAKR